MRKLLPLLVFFFALRCGGTTANEPVVETEQAVSSTYNILVFQVFRQGATVTWPQFSLNDSFTTNVRRVSYADLGGTLPPQFQPTGIKPQYNILPPIAATPAQVGCGGSNEQHTAMQFAINQAIAMGVNFAPYKHFWFAADLQHSFVAGGCSGLYGTSGGRNFGYTGITDNTVGMLWTSSPNDTTANALHEFEHGYAPNGYSHEYLLNCPNGNFIQSVTTAGCTRTEVGGGGLPSYLDALGGNPNQADPLYNETAWYKFKFGWIPATRVATVQPNGTFQTSLTNQDSGEIGGSTFPVIIRVNRPDGRYFIFERRQHALVGNNGTTNAFGVYVYVLEPAQPVGDVPAIILPQGAQGGFYNGIHPLSPLNSVLQIEPGLQVQDGPGTFRVTCNKAPGSTCP